MHLLTALPGGFCDTEGIVDLQQSPGAIVILSTQDDVLTLLANSLESMPENYPSVRLANCLHLTKPAAYDLYADRVLDKAQLIIVSLLGGLSYWPYGAERLELLAKGRQVPLAIVPGDDAMDEALFNASTVSREDWWRIWRYLREGGKNNAKYLFAFIGANYFAQPYAWDEPRAWPRAFLYLPLIGDTTFSSWCRDKQADWPTAALLFYRSHVQSANTAAFDAFIETLRRHQFNPLPIAVASLKDVECLANVNRWCAEAEISVILNTTGFALQRFEHPLSDDPGGENRACFAADVPVFQVIAAANTRDDWLSSTQGLRARDIAMNVALPELDGRIITRAVTFKHAATRSTRTESDLITYQLEPERAEFVASLAYRWATLRRKANSEKRVALILANYPTRNGRIGNGVGLDTPASSMEILRAMLAAGYPIENLPADSAALIAALLEGVTNDLDTLWRGCQQSMALDDYQRYFSELPIENQQAVLNQWGVAEQDPKARAGRIMIPGIRLGLTFVGIQPSRGYNLDLSANYHSPDLVPPHAYLAFYFWLRHIYKADAIIHVGKHGNLEWLPGKSLALSPRCWPEIALGPMPHLYPFIINDPGEGAQAKRRAQAVIIDHLMPPMTRAESYGPLAQLEQLLDEYYQAQGLDDRRVAYLRDCIVEMARDEHILEEIRANQSADNAALLTRLDAYLCELKEAQIRDGLHIFGHSPAGEQRVDTLVALTRLPRGEAPNEQGILHCLVQDLALWQNDKPFDPLDYDAAQPWMGNRPAALTTLLATPWHTTGDTRERLELLAQRLVCDCFTLQTTDGFESHILAFAHTMRLFKALSTTLIPSLDRCGSEEIRHLLRGLSGYFVPPGPSGAPTRGRLDVLPTGRNFYSIDTRAIPTPAAWALGSASAEQLILRHLQDYGEYPRQLGLSVWGTATMRTGGDDIAQAFALMGIKPIWASGSNRVTDFEIIPGIKLQRPRVDVTLRVSGFFRDAFPNVMHLFDAAAQALMDLDEESEINSLQVHVNDDATRLMSLGLTEDEAHRQARWRVFGSKPGAYGAGLQGLIDERCWETPADLCEAYLQWGGYAYGQNDVGTQAREAFSQRLTQFDAVVQNQDNREHDLLDSDDYYQFQGGMANAVRTLKGTMPAVYHGDHSNPALPRIRTLQEELQRVIRSRVLNPKWLTGMRRHGYKGAFEMAATVDYLFAYSATTDLIADYHYAAVSEAYLFDAENRAFLEQHNPHAMKEMAERLLESIQRGLWQEPGDYGERLENLLLTIDQTEEGSH